MSVGDNSVWRNLRPEDPRRVRRFRERTESLQWDAANAESSLSELFAAVDDLAESEVRYYYRRRGTRALISSLARFLAWLLGSVGLLLPLLAGTAAPVFRDWGQYGYVFLAAAACLLGANALFGGTSGHVRFVQVQLELEKLIAESRIAWCRHLASTGDSRHLDAGFELVLAYAQGLHAATLAETGRWGEDALSALAEYRQSIKSRASGKH